MSARMAVQVGPNVSSRRPAVGSGVGRFNTGQPVYNFCKEDFCKDGKNPLVTLVQGSDGDFYGTTNNGGAGCGTTGCGTIFKVTPQGALTTLYTFCAAPACATFFNPNTLIQATSGEL